MKKLISKYGLMSAATLACISSNAEIIYTDVDPDETYSGKDDQYDVDFDSDGNIDIAIYNSSTSASGTYYYGGFNLSYSFVRNAVAVYPYSGNGILGTITTMSTSSGSTYTNNEFTPVRANEIISASQSFISNFGDLFGFGKFFVGYGGFPFYSGSGLDGNFNDTIFDRFMGVRFKIGSQDDYGWVRLGVEAQEGSQSFTIFDYAYEDSGLPILAGEGIVSPGAVSIENRDFDNLKITSFDNIIQISSTSTINGVVEISNINGQVLLSKNINSNQLNLDVKGFSKGIYVVTIKSDDKLKSQKVVI